MKKNNLYTIIFLIVGGLLIFVVGFYSNQMLKNAQEIGENFVFGPIKHAAPKTAINPKGQATLSFLPSSGEQKIGKLFDVGVVLNSQEQKNYGADIIINYDPLMLELTPVEKIEPTDCSSQSNCVDRGTRIINKWQDGEIIFSYLAPAGVSWQSEMKIAYLTFAPKKAGVVDLKFNFQPNSSTDCNVAGDNGQDILSHVNNAQFIVK